MTACSRCRVIGVTVNYGLDRVYAKAGSSRICRRNSVFSLQVSRQPTTQARSKVVQSTGICLEHMNRIARLPVLLLKRLESSI